MKKKLVLLLATLMCISLCACGGSETSSGNNTDTKTENSNVSNTEQEIEITLDNWQDYFELVEVVRTHENYNAFDELVSETVEYDYCLTIKDNYEIDMEKSNVAIELKGRCEDWSVNVDTDTLAITYLEKIKDFQTYDRECKFEQLFKNIEQLDREVYYGVQLSPKGEPYGVSFDEETQVGTVHRYFIDEVVRIQGTIYVKETEVKEETVDTAETVDTSNMTVEEMQTYYDIEKYLGTPRIEKLKVGNYNKDSESILLSNFEEVGNIKEYEIAVDNRLGVYKKYDCIITDNNTPNNWKDDVVVYIFIQ